MKAHQRIIREQKAKEKPLLLFPDKPSVIDIKNATVRPVSYKTAEKIIKEYEWLGGMGNAYKHYGIYFNGYCGGVVCFGFPSASASRKNHHPLDVVVGKNYGQYVIQLVRGACVHWAHPHSATKLISSACKQLKNNYPIIKIILAYADENAGEIGTIYQADNWLYIGKNDPKNRNSYYVINGIPYDPRDAIKLFNSVAKEKLKGIDPEYYTIKRSAKHQYLKWVGSKGEKKQWMKNIIIQPYPKRIAVQDSRENRSDTIGESLGQYQSTAQYLNDKNNIRMRQNV